MVNTLSKTNPNNHTPPKYFSTHHLRLDSLYSDTQKSAPLDGGDVTRKNNLTVFLCSSFGFVPAAQPIEPIFETTTPACC